MLFLEYVNGYSDSRIQDTVIPISIFVTVPILSFGINYKMITIHVNVYYFQYGDTGTVTVVHADGTVSVKWDDGLSYTGPFRFGEERGKLSLI